MTLLCVNGDSDSDSGAILAVNFRAGFISDILKNIVTNKGVLQQFYRQMDFHVMRKRQVHGNYQI